MLLISVHFDVSHLLRSELKEEAPVNIWSIFVHCDVSHLLRLEFKEQ